MSRRSRWRHLGALLLALAGFGVLGVMVPSTASAIPGISDCKNAPTPEVPGRGVEAFFSPAPAVPPPPGDPFAKGATTSVYEQYGYAGLRWNTYDLGCTGAAGSPEASVGSTVANWLFTIPKAVVSATGAMLGAAYEPSFLSVFDPLIETVVDALRRSVFDQWAGLVLAALGFVIIWKARQSSLRTTAAALGWALLVMMIATVLFRWPVTAGRAADATVVSTMSAVTASLNDNAAKGAADAAAARRTTSQLAAANLHSALLYHVWLGGEFGDANSVTALRYGPSLFDAQALTWAEAATLSQDPAAGQRIIEAKQAQFKQIAAQVKVEDPDAYEYLTGRRSDARVGFAALALLAVACAVPFLLVSALLVIGALVITRFAVMLFPAIATLGLFPAMRGLVVGVGNTVAAAVINAIFFGVATAVMVKGYGVVMSPGNGLPSWLVVALVLLMTLVMWYALRPIQRLTGMVAPGRSHFSDGAGALGSVTRGLGRVGGRLMTTAAGVLGGESAAGKDKSASDDENRRDPHRRRAEADHQSDREIKGGGGGTHSGGSGTGNGTDGGGRGGGRRLPGRSRPGPPQPVEADDPVPVGASSGNGSRDPRRRPGSRPPGRGSGAARGAGGELIAAEVGFAPSAATASPAVRGPHSRSPEGRSAGDRRSSAEPAVDEPPRDVPARRARMPVRRSEGADLDDLGVWAPAARGAPAPQDDLSDPYSVYRPGERAGGGAHD